MSLPYFPMYPSDFEAKTSHLTIAEDGAYNRLLRICWMTPGCTMPADEVWIMRRVRAHCEADKEAVRAVLAEFFTIQNGRYSNARLMREWLAANEKHTKRVLAGAKGGKAKALKGNNMKPSNAVAKPYQPEPEPEPVKRDTKVSLGDLGFSDFWALWPSKKSKEPALKAWRKMNVEDRRSAFSAIRDGWFERWRQSQPDANPIHASTFLNGKRWQDEFTDTPQLKAIQGGQHGQSSRKSEQRINAFVSGARGAS